MVDRKVPWEYLQHALIMAKLFKDIAHTNFANPEMKENDS